MTSKQVTSPPWNSRRLVHSKEMVWASRWSVALRAFYRQILSLTYSFFSLKLPPPACPGTTGILNAKRMKGRILVNLIESTWYILIPGSAHDTAYTYAIIRCTYHSPAWKLLPGKQSCRITDAYRMLQSIKYLHFWCLGGGEPCRCDSRGIKNSAISCEILRSPQGSQSGSSSSF